MRTAEIPQLHVLQFASDYLWPVYRESGSAWVRKGMVAWANQRGYCAHCLKPIEAHEFHADHILPLSRGGSNGQGNIQALCAPCNLSKGNRVGPKDRGRGELAGLHYLRQWYVRNHQPGWPSWEHFLWNARHDPEPAYRWLHECWFFARPCGVAA